MPKKKNPMYLGGGTVIRHGDPDWYSNTEPKPKPSEAEAETEKARRRREERERQQLKNDVESLAPKMRDAYLIGKSPEPIHPAIVVDDKSWRNKPPALVKASQIRKPGEAQEKTRRKAERIGQRALLKLHEKAERRSQRRAEAKALRRTKAEAKAKAKASIEASVE
jgi:hypothetical protein